MHINNNSIQTRQNGETSQSSGNGSHSAGRGGKEEGSVWENSPVTVSTTYGPITEGTRLRNFRGHAGWEIVCSAENRMSSR